MRKQLMELSRQGHNLIKSGRFHEARRLFEEGLHMAPDDLYFMTGMGDVLRNQKEFSAAAGYYRRVLDIDRNNPFALRGLGDALRGKGNYREAIECWKKYLRQKGFRDIFVITRIADCLKTIDSHAESESYYKRALEIQQTDRYALMGLADLYHKMGLEQKALGYYEKAVENGVTMISILTIVGNLHMKFGNYEAAMPYFENALKRESDNSFALYGLGSYYRWKNDYSKAVEFWERILVKGPGTVNLMARLGDAYYNLGRHEDAERAYRSNLDKEYDMFSMAGFIRLRCIQGRIDEACDSYDILLQHEREDRSVFTEVGDLLIGRNEKEMALRFFHHALQRLKDAPLVSGIIKERIKQLEEN